MGWSSGGDAVAALNAQAIAMGWGTRCYEDLDFVQPELNALRDVWRGKARATGWPSRADFDARSLKPFLTHIAILERVANEDGTARYRFRLSGTDLVRQFGEPAGRMLDEVLPAQFLERWTAGFDTVLASRQPLRFVSRLQLPQVNWLEGECFLAPLANGAAPPTMILGAMYMTKREQLRAAG
jgi:hypothetical protein